VNATTVPDRIWPSLDYITGVDGFAMFPPVGYQTERGKATGFVAMTPPDYLNDLNAMHGAEKMLECGEAYETELIRSCKDAPIWHATATQRAEAFLRTLNLWTE